jgi:error-prone DNA polymerase
MKGFIHLNVHSHYSKGWGTATLEELCRRARELGMTKLALTDTNGLYGLLTFVRTARDFGIDPLVGSELVHEGRRAVLLVRTPAGYANLCRILSARHCDQGFDLLRELREKREGLIVLTDSAELLKALARDGRDDLFVEMSPGYRMGRAYALARRSGIPPAATNRVFLLRREDFALHRILRAVSLNTKLSRLGPQDTCREYDFLAPADYMFSRFSHAPAAVEATIGIAEACLSRWDFNRIIFPRFKGMTDEEAFATLYRRTLEGCRRRYGAVTPAVRRRVEHEMRIIRAKNFAHYFLVVADITRRAQRSCGRGSAAASIVAYALGITHVDPIRHNLFFERFLNPERLDPPDIDVDFAWDERDQILDEVFALYGTRRAALVANHNTFAARAAIRETAKVFGLTDGEIGRVTGKIGWMWHLGQVWKDLPHHPRMRGFAFTEPWNRILPTAARLESHFHHLSTHCGGMVVVPDEIRRYCPVEISASGLQILQWEKDAVEEAGLVKIDLLGNRSLAGIRDALRMVEKNHGRRIDYADLNPLDDPETIRVFYRGDTFGVFYFESPATRQVLAKVSSKFTFEEYRRLDHFHLNVVVTSIIRPASNDCIHTWVSRLHGEPWEPAHPLLRPALQETLGVMVFQEQLSQAAIYLAGFTPAEADTLRKVVSKKDRIKKLQDFAAKFDRGARRRGAPSEVIEEVWEMILGYEGYSFCKPHSASYTMVAYKCAFLRAHYPAEFMAAVLSNGGGYYSTFGYLSEARRMGLTIRPPDINRSEIPYSGKGREIRVGLMQIKELSQEAREAIVHEREKAGPFRSFTEFLARCPAPVHLQDTRILIKAGCFDGIARHGTRAALMWEALEHFSAREVPMQATLFSAPAAGSSAPLPAPRAAGVMEPASPFHTSYPRALMLKHELETFGFFLSIHPLDRYQGALAALDILPARDLRRGVGRRVVMAGWPITSKTVHTKKGEAMIFISFEDQTGIYETVLFPAVYHRYCHRLNEARPYLLHGKVEETYGVAALNVQRIAFLDEAAGRRREFVEGDVDSE